MSDQGKELIELLQQIGDSGLTMRNAYALSHAIAAIRERDSLRAQLASAKDVEKIARAIYEAEPHYEPGEYVDGFAVSPGGNLSWEQALARDAEFASDPLMGSITAFAYRAARAVVSLTSAYRGDEK